MGKDDYASTGGALKLKGVKDGGVKKKKKKDKKKDKDKGKTKATEPAHSDDEKNAATHALEEPFDPFAGKTEAERRFLERRWKMMDEKFKKEGVKTHKERVEEYNRYLASLSEHHDMPRIGPG